MKLRFVLRQVSQHDSDENVDDDDNDDDDVK